VLLSAGLDFLKIKNVKTAQVGTDRINPRRSEVTMQVTNPAIARVLLRLTAPHNAGIAPIITPPKIEPSSEASTKGSMVNPPKKKKSVHVSIS
jgi:hypothetical protein